MVPTMIYVLLDHPRLDKTDLASLELIPYGALADVADRLVEGLERIGPGSASSTARPNAIP